MVFISFPIQRYKAATYTGQHNTHTHTHTHGLGI